jgi:predicted DNA-binding antitoxin AbrB/MazE fold protein
MKMERRKAKWENGVLKLDKPLDLPEGSEVTVIIVPTIASLRGILKHVQQDSVSLQHSVGEIWAEAMHGGDRQ